jgi:hypothetical protein
MIFNDNYTQIIVNSQFYGGFSMRSIAAYLREIIAIFKMESSPVLKRIEAVRKKLKDGGTVGSISADLNAILSPLSITHTGVKRIMFQATMDNLGGNITDALNRGVSVLRGMGENPDQVPDPLRRAIETFKEIPAAQSPENALKLLDRAEAFYKAAEPYIQMASIPGAVYKA